jgi:2,3-bisphosphoglycerate-dependent phosphoglycerate mutase
MVTGTLVLLRHGESEFNAAQVFTGLLDVDLTPRGEEQAREAGLLLRTHDLLPDVVLTSPMQRCARTTDLVRESGGLDGVPVTRSWRLAERDYGNLTGVPKHEAKVRLGAAGYITVRRTLDGAPSPATEEQATSWPAAAYTEPGSGLPSPGSSESLRDVIGRVAPLWDDVRDLLVGARTVLVVGHGNSLRALCAVIDELSPAEVQDLNLPPGEPLVYRWTADGLTPRGGRYLDPDDALAAAARIAHEGGT